MSVLQDLERYRDQREQARHELAGVDARRTELLVTIRRYDALIGEAIQLPLPWSNLSEVPPSAVQRANARRATTRVGRATRPNVLNATDRRVLLALQNGGISFGELKKVTGINEWTLRDALVRLQVAGAVHRHQGDPRDRGPKYAKASLPFASSQRAVR